MSEQTIGLVLRGEKSRLERLVRDIERDEKLKILFIKRPRYEDPFLLIIELKKHTRGE